jgi:hypothetical protein
LLAAPVALPNKEIEIGPLLEEETRALLTVEELLVRVNDDELTLLDGRDAPKRLVKDENLALVLPEPDVSLDTLELVAPERLDKDAKMLATLTIPPETCSSSSFFLISRIILILQN